MNKKNILITLGTAAAITLPFATVISCGANSASRANSNKERNVIVPPKADFNILNTALHTLTAANVASYTQYNAGTLTISNLVYQIAPGALNMYCGIAPKLHVTTLNFETGSIITTIPSGVFTDFNFLNILNIPDSVTTIGVRAFLNANLYELKLGANVKTIGNQAFNSTVALKTIVFPKSVTSIGDYAFAMSSNLTTITFVQGLKSIGEGAFYNTKFPALTKGYSNLSIPASVTSIGVDAFHSITAYGNKGTSSVTFEGSAPINKKQLTIAKGAFSNCYISDMNNKQPSTQKAWVAWLTANALSAFYGK